MKADRELKREIKRANGDGSRDAKFELIRRVKAACAAMSTTKVAGEFYEILHEHGRVPVALCVAATIYARRERLDYWCFQWAHEVLDEWSTRPPSYVETATINDGLHPTRICEYAGEFIRMASEEG